MINREADTKLMHQKAMTRLENPIVDIRQKIPAGEEVYIRPIYEPNMLHFEGDVITVIKGTYAQMYTGEAFSSYSTEIGAWYDEDQLMPTKGKSIEECQNACKEYFNTSYEEMLKARSDVQDKCPLRKMFKAENEALRKRLSEAFINGGANQ